jgi:hypothetical protein
MPLLGREGIEEAFRRLGDRLAKRGVVADVYVFGGAAMALAYDSRRATRDVDALFKPHGIVLEEAQAVAAELGLHAVDEVLALVRDVFPEEEPPARLRLLLEDIFDQGD